MTERWFCPTNGERFQECENADQCVSNHVCRRGVPGPPWADRQTEVEVVETVNHPAHYGGDTVYETIKVIEAWSLGFCLGNAIKYISRAGNKPGAQRTEDLGKAAWYLQREISGGIESAVDEQMMIFSLERENTQLVRRVDELEAALLHQES